MGFFSELNFYDIIIHVLQEEKGFLVKFYGIYAYFHPY